MTPLQAQDTRTASTPGSQAAVRTLPPAPVGAGPADARPQTDRTPLLSGAGGSRVCCFETPGLWHSVWKRCPLAEAHAVGAVDLHSGGSQRSSPTGPLPQPGNRRPRPPAPLRDAAARRRGISSAGTHTKKGF